MSSFLPAEMAAATSGCRVETLTSLLAGVKEATGWGWAGSSSFLLSAEMEAATSGGLGGDPSFLLTAEVAAVTSGSEALIFLAAEEAAELTTGGEEAMAETQVMSGHGCWRACTDLKVFRQ